MLCEKCSRELSEELDYCPACRTSVDGYDEIMENYYPERIRKELEKFGIDLRRVRPFYLRFRQTEEE